MKIIKALLLVVLILVLAVAGLALWGGGRLWRRRGQLRRDQAYGCGALYVQPRTETTGQADLVYVSGRNSRALHQQVHSRAHSGLG